MVAVARPPEDIPEPVLRLALAGGIGPTTFDALIERFESLGAIAGASIASLRNVEGLGLKRAASIRRAIDEADPDSERRKMSAHDARLIVRGDPDYPRLLAQIPDPPIALWIRGELEETDQVAIAIVGSRNCTAYGRDQTGRLGALLAQSGFTIISGGARGIDGEAHRAALRVEGRTIAVVGCGLAHTYPPEHEDLFNRIADGRGALVSEFPMALPPLAGNFPKRNRIISGLALGVLVTEAGLRSGSLITARQAAEDHNREVMAVPGRVDSPASQGALRAIKEGWAAMVLDHSDVIAQLESSRFLIAGAIEQAYADEDARRTPDALANLTLTDGQERIVAALREHGDGLTPDELTAETQLPMHALMAEVTVLEIRRIVARVDGRIRLKSGVQ